MRGKRMQVVKKKVICSIFLGLIFLFGSNVAQAASEREVFDEYLSVEYTDKIAWGDNYILLKKIEAGFSSSDSYYGLYDYVNGDWVIDYRLFDEGYIGDAKYAGEGMFLFQSNSDSYMSSYLINGNTGEVIQLNGLSVSNLKFVDGIAVARASEADSGTDIYVIYDNGSYYSTDIMRSYENTDAVIHDSFFRNEKYAVYIFSNSTFIIYDLEEDDIISFDRADYGQKLTAISSEAELSICGNYMVYLNMEGNDGKNYCAVTTLDGTDYLAATACDYSVVTEDKNLLIVTDGVAEEIPLANEQLSEIQPISNLALVACEKEDREEMEVNIDRKNNLYQNSIVYQDIFYLDTNPPYDIADIYYLGGKYSAFSGTWYLPDDTLEDGLVYVRLIGDGKVIYESTILDAQSCYENFSVDVSGIRQLGIEYNGTYGLGDVAVGLADGSFVPAGVSAADETDISNSGNNEGADISNLEEQDVAGTVKLYDLHAYIGGLDKSVVVTDNVGNTYDKAIRAYSNEESATYDIGGRYSLLSGTVAVTKADQNNYNGKSGYIRIYGDGNLLWEDADLNIATKPYAMSVDISGVTDLRVEMRGFPVNFMWNSLGVIFDNVTLTS